MFRNLGQFRILQTTAWLLGLAVLLLVLVGLLRQLPEDFAFGQDYIQFWSASTLLVQGENPYDAELQAEVNQRHGWDIETDGLGRYPFLPYYYPPWLGLVMIALLPFGYSLAKTVWVGVLAECVLVTGFLVRNAVPKISKLSVMLVYCAFGVWLVTVLKLGQVAPLVGLCIAASWRLLEHKHDRSAGWALACLSIKPQLTLLLMVAVCIWAARQRRWRVLEGFFTACAVFGIVSTLVYPFWLPAMLRAPQEIPLVTVERPERGTTWMCMLESLGLEGVVLVAGWMLLALPLLGIVVRDSWDRHSSSLKVIGGSLLAAFFLAPYARYYDLPMLLFPLLWLLGRPLSGWLRALLLLLFLVLPYAHLFLVPADSPLAKLQVCWFWMALVLVVVWLMEEFRGSEQSSKTALSGSTSMGHKGEEE